MALSVQEILDADIPQPMWVWNPTPANPVAPEMNPFASASPAPSYENGEWKEVGTDEVRFGRGGGVLLDQQATEKVKETTDIGGGFGSTRCTILSESIASEFNDQNPNVDARAIRKDDGAAYVSPVEAQTKGSIETMLCIVESYNNQYNNVRMSLRDKNNFDSNILEFSLQDGSVIKTARLNYYDVRPLGIGPNGGRLYEAFMRYNTPNIDETGRIQAQFYPARDAWINANATTILHYLGRRHNDDYNAPIIGDGTFRTRAGATAVLPITDDIWNDDAVSIFARVRATHDRSSAAHTIAAEYTHQWISRSNDVVSGGGPNTDVAVVNANPYEFDKICVTATRGGLRLTVNGVTDYDSTGAGDLLDYTKANGLRFNEKRANDEFDVVKLYGGALTEKQHKVLTS